MILVTGGAGFIGANFVRDWLGCTNESVLVIDKLTYSGNRENLRGLDVDARYAFVHGDIGDRARVSDLMARHRPRAIVHFAAETHVDRSIDGPGEFVRTNVNGTFELLEAARAYHARLAADERDGFRFLHVSTDEVYGSLGPDDPAFTEATAYAPNSPYAASKAASDHLVRAYHHTYGLPTLTTNCSNNYGPYQLPEKLIPLVILHALEGKPLPIYGDGRNVRDWLYVGDHCAGVRAVLERGVTGATYNIGGENERTNIDVVRMICAILDELRPRSDGRYADQITFVKDRPGHDRRYAINAARIRGELGWRPFQTFEAGLRLTVAWYLDNLSWVESACNGAHRAWIQKQYSTSS